MQITRMMDLFLSHYDKWGSVAQIQLQKDETHLREDDTFTELNRLLVQSGNQNNFLKAMPKIVSRIVYSKIISQHWKEWV